MMKKYFFLLTMLFYTFQSNAQVEVTVDTNNPIFGFANVFETPANGGGYVFGSPWGIPDLKSVIDVPGNIITLQPNFNTWNPADPFWVVNGMANKWFEGNTYFEDNTLAGQPFSFVGGCLDYTLDPVYEVVAFIKVFNGDFSVLKLETTSLVPGENFAVTYTNVEPEDTFIQYGFWVFGPIADPANEPTLGSVIVSSPIPNDVCGVATPVIGCGETLSGDTSDDTDTNGDGSPDEWFAVTSSIVDEIITVSTCNQADYDTILTVYDSCGGAVVETNDDGVGCSGFTSELSFQGDGSTTYYIAVDGFGGGSGTFDLTVSCALPPENDICPDAIAVDCNSSVSGTTINATIDTDVAPDCDTGVTSPGVWYVYEDTTGLVTDITITMCSGNGTADYDSKLSVYTGDCGAPPLTCVAGNDDTCGLQSEVSFQSDGATTYYILVHGFGGATGDFTLDINCTPVPPPNDDFVDAIEVLTCPWTDENVAMPAATTESGNPQGCDISGANGVWYKAIAPFDGYVTCTVENPSGATYVLFFSAPSMDATIDELVLIDYFDNQCAPSNSTTVPVVAGGIGFTFVVNTGGITDVTFDCEFLGVEDNQIAGFNYYPNPATEMINLSALDNIDNVILYNVLGQKVIDLNVDAVSTQLNVSNLSTGAYFMKVSVNGILGTYKIIKQ